MKLTLLKEELITPLQMAAGAAERGSEDVHSHVLVSADQGDMQITGVGHSVQVSSHGQSSAKDRGETTLPARKLLDICKTLPDGSKIDVDVKEDVASLKIGRSRFKLRVFAPESFPSHAEEKPDVSLQIPAGKLRRMLSRTSFAVAAADVRRYLTGLLLEMRPEEKMLCAVATDGHRLAVNRCPLDDQSLKNAPKEASRVIIPMPMVQQMGRLLDGLPDGEAVQLEFGAKGCRLATPQQQVQSLAIDGDFPDYERVIPEDQDNVLLMLCAPLREALVRAAVILESEATHAVKLQLENGKIQVLAENQQGEEYEEELDAEYKGEPLSIALNLNYVRDMLDAFSAPQFQMHLKDPGSSVRVDPVAPEGEAEELKSVYVLMPMRL